MGVPWLRRMNIKRASNRFGVTILAVLSLASWGSAAGFDTGLNALALVTGLRGDNQLAAQGNGWLRLRGIPEPGISSVQEIAAHQRALAELQARGFHTCVLMMPAAASWAKGVRALPGSRLPIDLTEAFAWGQRLGRTYGALVDAWEIDNEPDIGFLAENPEAYAAFFKAVALGIRAGAGETEKLKAERLKAETRGLKAGELKPEELKPERLKTERLKAEELKAENSDTSGLKLQASSLSSPASNLIPQVSGLSPAASGFSSHLSTDAPAAKAPRVLMAPLALPPGPYFERLMANEFFSYTDGFNYHYYGYAEDFSEVYGQFEMAVGRTIPSPPLLGAAETNRRVKDNAPYLGSLPVFLTEYGYGMLGADTRNTVAGRVAQWRWFRDVYAQATRLRIEGAMAFYLPPYLELGFQEFGLSMARGGGQRTEDGGRGTEDGGRGTEDGGRRTGDRGRRTGRALQPGQATDLGVGRIIPNPPPVNDADASRRIKDNPPYLKQQPVFQVEPAFTAGGLTFRPTDFGAEAVEPWMQRIGAKVNGNEASPALAWLLDQSLLRPALRDDEGQALAEPGKLKSETGNLKPETPNPSSLKSQLSALSSQLSTLRPQPSGLSPQVSPVVIDFVAGRGMLAVKQCQGFFLTGAADGSSTGMGELRIYNFSNAAISGRLEVGELARSTITSSTMVSLSPGQMRIVPVRLQVKAEDLHSRDWTVRFVPAQPGATNSIFSTQLYVDASRLVRRVVANLGVGDAGVQNAQVVDTRPIASEEPPAHAVGRWRVSQGIEVAEGEGVWRFTVTGFPAESLRPAVAELVLPDGFELPEGSLLELGYRIAPRSPASPAAATKEPVGICWRTANGNLFTVWRPPAATATWQNYGQMKRSFTMAFFGRAKLPWRFSENRPVSLVFQFRPSALPVTFEVKHAVISAYGR